MKVNMPWAVVQANASVLRRRGQSHSRELRLRLPCPEKDNFQSGCDVYTGS